MSTTVIVILIVAFSLFVLRSLSAQTSSNAVHLTGPGSYDFDIVGEASYQDALAKICGGKKEKSAEHHTDAELYLEDENPHDNKAVCVSIEGQTVGYLSRKDARAFRRKVKSEGQENSILFCKAVIVGGWKNARDEGNYGVKLDLP